MPLLHVACIQMRSSDDVSANILAASSLIREAKEGGAELIATPEMTSLLDRRPGALLEKTVPEPLDPALSAFTFLARELHVWLLIGSLPIRITAERCANRSFLVSPMGEIVSRYDKIHMFDADLGAGQVYAESEKYSAGSEAVLAETPIAHLGLTICYDVRFPQLYRELAQAGADIIAVPSAFTQITGEAHWHTLLRARAIETGCFIIAPAQGGHHADGRETYGHSLIIGPWGEILAEGGVGPGVVHAKLDIAAVTSARTRIPSLRHDRHFKIGKDNV